MTLKELLNKIIDKWFNPFGWYKHSTHWETCNWVYGKWVVFWCDDNWEWDWKTQDYTLRELVSKESWLWQFVCDNKIQNTTDWEYERRLKKASDCWWDGSEYNTKNDGWYEYRIIESALKDESELEDFLLSNIKVDG